MRRWKVATAALSLALGAVIAFSLTPALSAGKSPVVKVVYSKDSTEHETDVNVGCKCFNPGDGTIIRGPVFDSQSGKRAGTQAVDIVVIRAGEKNGLFQVTATFAFPGEGKLMVVGTAALKQLSKGASFAVVGGTGRYARASGTVTVEGKPHSTWFTFDVA